MDLAMFCGRRRVCRSLTSGLALVIGFCFFALMQFYLSENQGKSVIDKTNVNQGIDSRHILSTEEIDVTILKSRDKKLVQHVRNRLTISNGVREYFLDDPTRDDYSRGQSKIIDNHLKSKENGFFIDIGASDGETGSLSLYFERLRAYEGILVEPDPSKVQKLKSKGRRSSIIPHCIRTISGSTTQSYSSVNSSSLQEIPCLWMETILLSTGRNNFDILSINQKHNELEILKTIPFPEFHFNVISIEFETSTSPSQQAEVVKYLSQFQYQAYHQFTNHPLKKIDIVFVKVL